MVPLSMCVPTFRHLCDCWISNESTAGQPSAVLCPAQSLVLAGWHLQTPALRPAFLGDALTAGGGSLGVPCVAVHLAWGKQRAWWSYAHFQPRQGSPLS